MCAFVCEYVWKDGFRFWHHSNVGYNNCTCLGKDTARSNKIKIKYI